MSTPAARRRAVARQSKSERERLAREAAAERQEVADEEITPAAQRRGTSLRGALVVRDGNTFRVGWDAMVALRRAGVRREAAGKAATITSEHEKAAARLVACARQCESISAGVGSYGERCGGVPAVGYIPHSRLAAVEVQHLAQRHLRDAKGALGLNWPVVYWVVLRNTSIAAYAEGSGMEAHEATGLLAGALNALVAYWRGVDG